MTSQTKEEKKEELSPKLNKIVEEIEKLSLLEVSDLVKALEKKFGISASMPLAVAQAPAAAAAATTTTQEEKTEFTLILSSAGANKISAIKAVREIKPEMGLKEAKDFVEAAPQELLKGVDKKTAEEAKKKLEAAGCQVELK